MHRWLCHTAVTPILTVRTRSYLLAHILRPITIRVGYQLARRTNVQATFDTIRLRVVTTLRAGLRSVPLVLFQYLHTTFFAFVVEVLVDAVERPRMEFLVAGLVPIRLTNVLGPTYREPANTAFDTFSDDGVRENVVEMCLTVSELSPCPHRLLRWAVLTFSIVLSSGEVVFVLFERVAGVQDVLVRESNRGNVRDAEVDACYAVTC